MESSPGGIRMFRDSDIEWLRVIGCMKKAGMSIKDIRQYIELALKGDDTIELRLKMFQRQKEVLRQKLEKMQHTMDMVDYKCWYYETARSAGTVEVTQNMDEKDVPQRFREIRRELKNTDGKS